MLYAVCFSLLCQPSSPIIPTATDLAQGFLLLQCYVGFQFPLFSVGSCPHLNPKSFGFCRRCHQQCTFCSFLFLPTRIYPTAWHSFLDCYLDMVHSSLAYISRKKEIAKNNSTTDREQFIRFVGGNTLFEMNKAPRDFKVLRCFFLCLFPSYRRMDFNSYLNQSKG